MSSTMNPSIRRGELDTPLSPALRRKLDEICRDLTRLQGEAQDINDDFLAYLISAAADEARDQLRDDLILRQECPSEEASRHASQRASTQMRQR
jgi:hypothetical protein